MPQTGVPTAGPAPRNFLRKVAPYAAGWLLLALLHLTLLRRFPTLDFGDLLIPAWLSAGLIGTELTLAMLAILAIAGLDRGLLAAERRFKGRAITVLAATARVTLLFGFLLAFGGSWASFVAVGQFSDLQSLEFARVNGSLLVEYVQAMHPVLLVLLPTAALAIASALLWGLPALLRRVPDRILNPIVRMVAGLVAVCVASAVASALLHGLSDQEGVRDPVTGLMCSWGRLYEIRRETSSGPLTRIVSSIATALAPETEVPGLRKESVPALRRPRIPMKDYVATVDRAAFRPHSVILVLVDSMRPDQLEAGGSRKPVLRRVDEVAREGRVFVDARTEASHTDYASLCPLSAHYPLRSPQVHRYPKDPPYPRVPIYDVLHAMGYRTAMVSSQDERWGQMLNYLDTGGLDSLNHGIGALSNNMMRNFRSDDRTVEAAIRWIAEDASTPYFLYLNLQNAHFPYPVPADWPRRFGKAPDFPMSLGNYPKERTEDVRNLYADALDFIDAQIGRVIDSLKSQGRWNDTIFVLVADHGQAFMEHGFGGHASKIYDEVMKVPLVFHGPEVPPGLDARPAELIDVPSSICHLLHLPPHPSFQGIDLFAPNPPAERSRFMVVHTPLATQTGVERGGWKLIQDERMNIPLLYDLKKDPGETRDAAREHPSILRELSRQLAEWRRLQLDYYRDPARMAAEYPPILPDAAH